MPFFVLLKSVRLVYSPPLLAFSVCILCLCPSFMTSMFVSYVCSHLSLRLSLKRSLHLDLCALIIYIKGIHIRRSKKW